MVRPKMGPARRPANAHRVERNPLWRHRGGGGRKGRRDERPCLGALAVSAHRAAHPRRQVMARRQVHLERVLGLLVRDVKGRKAGHLEEAHAEVRGGECFLTEYLLGGEGLLERLSVSNLSL